MWKNVVERGRPQMTIFYEGDPKISGIVTKIY
jgi:hypothetical protein